MRYFWYFCQCCFCQKSSTNRFLRINIWGGDILTLFLSTRLLPPSVFSNRIENQTPDNYICPCNALYSIMMCVVSPVKGWWCFCQAQGFIKWHLDWLVPVCCSLGRIYTFRALGVSYSSVKLRGHWSIDERRENQAGNCDDDVYVVVVDFEYLRFSPQRSPLWKINVKMSLGANVY